MQLLRGRQKKAQASSEQGEAEITFRVPELADVSPEYAALLDKRSKVAAEIMAVDVEIAAIWNEMYGANQANVTDRARVARVDAILNDHDDEQARQITIRRGNLIQRLEELKDRASDLREASTELERRISQAGNQASKIVCDQIEGHHRTLVLAMVENLKSLHEANVAYHRFVDDLNGKGIAWTRLGPMQIHWLGAHYSRESRTGHYLREAMCLGFITREDIPEELR